VFNNIWVRSVDVWSPTLREEHGLRVFWNRVLRRIFGLKRDEVTG
jgi:PAS domain-containing protein